MDAAADRGVMVAMMIDRKYSQMYNNAQYGFDPHDDSDNLEIAYNEVWGNGNHGTRESNCPVSTLLAGISPYVVSLARVSILATTR